ncbi:Ig-like domain-containing protein [Rosenbergiella collisarenosi]|uniref:Ig-like domain-containing protein n=1 Tax=Rosenbergiella collisarenosi TaxID=1544695 RepID=UPI001F4ED196|nr:Ig-like domain-containing protein [Rosenbergiella collisarenosi]
MEGCKGSSSQLIGRAKTLELAYGCADTQPQESDWKLLGLPTSATWDANPNSLNSDADDGGLTVTMISNADPTYSIDLEVRQNDRSDEFGIQQYVKYFFDEIMARRQPTVWMRFHWGDYYHIGYMNTTGLSDGGGVKDIVTASLELKLADGQSFQIVKVEKAVTGIVVSPTSANVAVGAKKQLSTIIAPSDASNTGVTWLSSDPTIATVDSKGLVSALKAGNATITATTADGGKTATSTITVTAA